MPTAGKVTVGRDQIYAYFSTAGPTARVRMSTDESDRLDLFPGRQVRVGFPGQVAGNALVIAVVPAPPFTWVEMELLGVSQAIHMA